jgi:hypothetical protein
VTCKAFLATEEVALKLAGIGFVPKERLPSQETISEASPATSTSAVAS